MPILTLCGRTACRAGWEISRVSAARKSGTGTGDTDSGCSRSCLSAPQRSFGAKSCIDPRGNDRGARLRGLPGHPARDLRRFPIRACRRSGSDHQSDCNQPGKCAQERRAEERPLEMARSENHRSQSSRCTLDLASRTRCNSRQDCSAIDKQSGQEAIQKETEKRADVICDQTLLDDCWKCYTVTNS